MLSSVSLLNTDSSTEQSTEAKEAKEEATKMRKYRPFAFSTQRGTGQYHVGPLDCCKKGECDICFDTMFCPCCLWAKLRSNVDFAKKNSRLYEEESSSSSSDDGDDDRDTENARVVKSELSRYEQRFSSDRSYYHCATCVQAGVSFLPLSFISTLCVAGLIDTFNASFGVIGKKEETKHEPLQCCSICCGEGHAEAGKTCDELAFFACTYTFLGPTCAPLYSSFYARELRHRQLYDGGCISSATPQVPSRSWLRRRKVEAIKELVEAHGKTRMKLGLDIYRVAWIVTRFLPKLKNRYQFFDANLQLPQME